MLSRKMLAPGVLHAGCYNWYVHCEHMHKTIIILILHEVQKMKLLLSPRTLSCQNPELA